MFNKKKKIKEDENIFNDEELGLDVNRENKEEKNDWLETEGQLTIDVYQTANEIVIKSAVAGVKPDNIDIDITGDTVTIKGERETEETSSGKDYFYQECYWGKFSRSIILPVDVDPDKTNAALKNGILTIRMPKINKDRTKKIKIRET